jgi:hypothetical protein
MQPISIAVISLHVLAAMFWAGTSFTLARTGGLGGAQLFRPQMGAATVAILAGGYMWQVTHAGAFDTAARVLALGAVFAIIAVSVQGAIGGRAIRALRNGTADAAGAQRRIALAQRVAAGLLAVTAVCMVTARYL